MSEGQDNHFAVAFPARFDFDDPLKAAKEFRQRWFGNDSGGRALFFLFSKNLGVTNVQFAELLSLLRLHTFEYRTNARATALYFVTSSEFDRILIEMVEPFEGEKDIGDIISDLYSEVFARTVVIDPHYGSCNVFLPPTLSANLAAIAGEAGYLHSCGYSVFVRNVIKAEPNLLRNKLSEHLRRFPPEEDKRLRFLVYADEDFTADDRAGTSILRSGLDDAKLHVEKAWFRTKRLVDVIDGLKETMSNQLVFGSGRGYLSDKADHHDQEDIDRTRTLWLIQDCSVGDPCEQPGEDRYYICYDQLFRARNAIHLFDENKPAWQDHTTLPPSLAGALVNIVRRPEKAGVALSVADPFVGTGTSLLEAMRFPEMSFVGSDIDYSSKLLVEDNLAFFEHGKEDIVSIRDRLMEAKAEMENALRAGGQSVTSTRIFEIATKLFGVNDVATQACDPEEVPRLCKERLPDELGERFLGYVAMRTSKRYSARFVRAKVVSDEDWCIAYLSELQTLLDQISSLIQLRSLDPLPPESEQELIKRYNYADGELTRVMLFNDDYSIASMPKEQVVDGAVDQRDDKSLRYKLIVGDAGNALRLAENEFDIVIGDPPYGFNTAKAARELAEFYREFARTALLALRDGGDLILCLPERSHSGRYSPAFTHRELVTQQLFLTAGEVKRQLVFPRDRVRGAERLYDSEYYWESEHALRRSVLHVQVRHKAPTGDGVGAAE